MFTKMKEIYNTYNNYNSFFDNSNCYNLKKEFDDCKEKYGKIGGPFTVDICSTKFDKYFECKENKCFGKYKNFLKCINKNGDENNDCRELFNRYMNCLK